MITPMEQAIKKAIEGGYGLQEWRTWLNEEPDIKNGWTYGQHDEVFGKEARNSALNNPVFWQSLGKSLGWSSRRCTECGEEHCKKLNHDFWEYVWQYQWHNFIDHLAEGKDIDSFFKELLNNK